MKKLYNFIEDNLTIKTLGISNGIQLELKATVNNAKLICDCKKLLEFIISYLNHSDVNIFNDETLSYGYWLIKFKLDDEGYLNIFEYTPDGNDFVEGVNMTLYYWVSQHEICKLFKADFIPPKPDQKVAISDGVYEGDSVEGVRYPSPGHMSGWWLTTNKYDGNIKSLKVVHLYHVTAIRPDIAKLIALPYGFRFFSNPLNVWFDQNIT